MITEKQLALIWEALFALIAYLQFQLYELREIERKEYPEKVDRYSEKIKGIQELMAKIEGEQRRPENDRRRNG